MNKSGCAFTQLVCHILVKSTGILGMTSNVNVKDDTLLRSRIKIACLKRTEAECGRSVENVELGMKKK